MLYSVSTHDHGMENREGWLNFAFCDDGKVVDKKERVEDEDENDVENTGRYEKSGVGLAWLGRGELV